ncbi:hypothetical protein IU500_15665 [Nocardia terpenica]|uniref:hypothetical protein n=1 Tax=Nocardia terpenica TaxID=455432 RepID=UPI00189378D0|nr:hypothetical protein [Nocardia terpenica]MBF6061290.1 hypothetical protein [Nocardia terpenica]MBF6105481.1 hypothetical protein [Nocardia terpenica]MBF6113049.1 hypothetical protein [Nocardia terpenica]MBF6119179.1 hypothetical protein [Nocardia terpenica]MBF6152827.1 hypothetical protein [Nocardia terpenica]
MTARIRHTCDNLLVLAGASAPRSRAVVTTVDSVLRAGIGEAEQYRVGPAARGAGPGGGDGGHP